MDNKPAPYKKPKPIDHLPTGQPVYGRNAKGQPICYKIKRDGTPCQSTMLGANGRCRAPGHQGTPHGQDSAHTRAHALKSLDLMSKFEKILADPALTSHRENMATLELLIQARIQESKPTIQFWEKAVTLYETVMGGGDGRAQALKDLGPVLQEGLAQEGNITEAVRLMDQQRRHKIAEAKREADLGTTLTSRQAFAFVSAVINAIKDEIQDPIVRNRVAGRVVQATDLTLQRRVD